MSNCRDRKQQLQELPDEYIDVDDDAVIQEYFEAVGSGLKIEISLSQLDDIIASIKFLQVAVLEVANKVDMPLTATRSLASGKSKYVRAMDDSYRSLNEMHRALIAEVVRARR